MSSKNQRSHAEHTPLPSLGVEESFSDDELDLDDDTDLSYEQSYPPRRTGLATTVKIVLGIAIGIGISFLIGAIQTTSNEPSPLLETGADGTTESDESSDTVVNSRWVVENVTATSPPFLLSSGHSAKETCESQGANRVWVLLSEDDDTRGKCLGRCGPGDHSGSDDDSIGFGEIGRVDGCSRHISGHHCCEKGPRENDPDGVNSCFCWASKLIPVENKKLWQ